MPRIGRSGFLGISRGQARAGTVSRVHPGLVDAVARGPVGLEGLPGQGEQGDGATGTQRALKFA